MLIDHVIGGKYRISELIGQGGMGTVFEAIHTGTGARVAIKLIVSNDIKEEVFVRFQREARAAGTIDSQHIVRIFDMGTDDRTGSPYMVMERLFGEDLSQLMRRVGAMEPQVALSLCAQAAMGLAKAHDSGVIHRDVKPANLFMHDGDAGQVVVKILDFGIAKVRMDSMQRAEEGGLTRTGSMLGSPHYMSPEQAQGLKTIDHRSDVWSLGVVLYKMLTGQTPHAHLQTLGQVILAICSQPARPVQELAPWVPPEVALIVHRALRQDPAERFQTAHEMYAAIQPLVAGMPPVRRSDIAALSTTQRARVAQPLTVYGQKDGPTNGTQHGLVQSPGAVPAKRGSGFVVGLAALGVLAAVGLAGIGASMMKKAPAALAAPEPRPETSTRAETSAAVAVSAPAERTVKLAISPSSAVVEADGQSLPVVEGFVDLHGQLGSVVAVRVSANGNETKRSVAITEDGAIPPKIVIGVATAAPPRTGKGGAAKPPPNGTGTALNVQRNFE